MTRRHLRCLPPLLAALLLAACATTPPLHAPSPAPAPTPSVPPAVPAPRAPAPARPAAPDRWAQLRSSFAMDDCDGDPQIEVWARRFTHNPRRFEARVSGMLPRLVFVQQIARQHDVAGEFTLLPWVESRFAPVPAHGNMPAGMWQIVPVTARTLHLQRSQGYDGRLDVPAATDAVMKLLERYHQRFDDWRLVDYAYNRGQYAVRRLLRKHGAPPAEPVIPALPVRKVTREHLIKLLAIACVIRQPDRFHVHLPDLPEGKELVVVRVDRQLSMAQAAKDAGMPLAKLKRLNSAAESIAAMPSPHLLLPREHADRLLQQHPEPALGADRADPPMPSATPRGPDGQPPRPVARGSAMQP